MKPRNAAFAFTFVYLALAISHRWTHDDGFINLRVVRNLVAGYGPVYNVGERVEVATSPLWILLLSVAHILGGSLEWTAFVVSLLCASTAMLLSVHLGWPPAGEALSTSRSPGTTEQARVPVGILLFAALPPAWQYASSGLETSLSCLWIVGCALLLQRALFSTPRREALLFVALGLGPLVRPDYSMYSAFFLLARLAALRAQGVGVHALVRMCAAAAALPLVTQFARMGYYGTMAPNTALAKEAFRLNMEQGRCYLDNLLVTYRLYLPLLALATLTVLRLRTLVGQGRAVILITLAPAAAALVHVGYLVAMGGDYMHARLLLPDVLALATPILWAPRSLLEERATLQRVGLVTIACWALLCAFRLRVAEENTCGIGDEYGWYRKYAGHSHPVTVADYARHAFLTSRRKDSTPRTLIGEKESFALAPNVDARSEQALLAGAIGMVGYSLPSSVHVIDKHGLADPIAARLEVKERGRPGHEKELSESWMRARFAEPSPNDPSDVLSARAALGCGAAAELLSSIEGALSFGTFLRNIARAPAHHRLRLPVDPFVAEAHLCEVPVKRDVYGGSGGGEFSWLCAKGHRARGLQVSLNTKENAVSGIALLCDGAPAGKLFGEASGPVEDIRCPEASALVGVKGSANNWLRSIGLVCSDSATVRSLGEPQGQAFETRCTDVERFGIAGRGGSLIDAAGVACGR
jgi:arabinofuranosyltransferase